MDELERIDIEKGQKGYMTKSDIIDILTNRFGVKYTASQIKKTKREDFAAELKRRITNSNNHAEGLRRAAARRSGLLVSSKKLFDIFK